LIPDAGKTGSGTRGAAYVSPYSRPKASPVTSKINTGSGTRAQGSANSRPSS